MNHQPIEKRDHQEDGSVEVHHIFKTIQGEGPFTGTPAVFIRLAGCNLQCPGCDTDYTSGRTRRTANEVAQEVEALWTQHSSLAHTRRLVVITGGEPFRQNLEHLFYALLWRGYYIQVETNGTLTPPQGITYRRDPSARHGVYIVCSPKTGKINPQIEEHMCCLKYVLSHDSVDPEDGLPLTALGHTAKPKLARSTRNVPIYLQPMDAADPVVNRTNLEYTIKSCVQHNYILQLQTHKLIGLE